MSAPVLDTHAWVWWLSRDPRLGASTLDALDALPAGSRPRVADISLWEVAMLVDRGRLALTLPLADWLELAAHPKSVDLVPISPAIAAEVAALPSSFHQNPADRLIVATCRVLEAAIVTHDRLITRSRLVKRWKP